MHIGPDPQDLFATIEGFVIKSKLQVIDLIRHYWFLLLQVKIVWTHLEDPLDPKKKFMINYKGYQLSDLTTNKWIEAELISLGVQF